MTAAEYVDALKRARSAFKTGLSDDPMPSRQAVTAATETARVNQWRKPSENRLRLGKCVPCVCAYLSTEVGPFRPEVQAVADAFDLVLVERRGSRLTFVPEDRL